MKNAIFKIALEITMFLMTFLLSSEVRALSVGEKVDFAYKKAVQEFKAPATGFYQLEVWGAQGGTSGGYAGGYGSYSTGVTFLNKNETIYIVTGEAGTGCSGRSCIVQPKYNGGGGCRAYKSESPTCASGGGATHIAKVSGVLSSLSQYKGTLSSSKDYYISEAILIVAAGGGGGAYTNGSNHGKGGHAGGYRGGNAISTGAPDYASNGYGIGATQIAGGCRSSGGACGSFGAGYSNTITNDGGANTGAGGGGFFGGGGTRVNSGAGGSGYIASSNLLSRNGITKTMYCYGCGSSTSLEMKTVQVSTVSASPVAGKAKTGSGYARITAKEFTNTNSKLDSITVSGGTFVQEFDPDTYVYDVVVDSENYNVDISAVVQEATSTIIGEGNYTIKAGVNDITLTVTADSGDVSIYQLHITRLPSSYKYLSDIKINDVSIPGFSYETLEYNVEVNYDVEKIDLQAIYGRPTQTINMPKDLSLKTGNNIFEIEVVSEDGVNHTTYKVNVFRKHTSKLKAIDLGEYSLEFDPDTLTYTLDVMKSTISISVVATPYDEEAKVSLSGFGYIKSSTTATITVTEPNCEPTVYTVQIVKNGEVIEEIHNFPFNGNVQTFVAPETGYYRLETWGAQGGTINSTYSGGYGAYATGVVLLMKEEMVYVVPGQAGTYCRGNSCIVGPRFNGGGGCRAYYTGNPYCSSGGGATHIAKATGTLSSLSSNKSSVLIVSGGGGGAGYTNGSNHGKGGHAGGYVGGSAISTGAPDYWANGYGLGGTQTAGGCRSVGGACGSFGLGYSNTTSNNGAANTGAGGGGYFGGGGTYVNSGGGGSGYIASSELKSYKEITKVMYCYACSTSGTPSTYTVSTKNVSSQPVSYYAKSGDGYAKITLLAQASQNNFLTTITTDKGTLDPAFDMLKNDYHVKLTPEEDTIQIDAVLEDETATLQGTGTFDVPAGQTTFPITVTAENGNVRVYNVVVEREPSSNSNPHNITIEGFIPNLCSIKEDYCKLDSEFDPDTLTYHVTVPSRIKKLDFIVEKSHKYQTVTGDGTISLETGMNTVVITVTAENGNDHSTYTYYIDRDMSGDNTIESLEVVEPQTEIHFDPDTTEYFFSIPNHYTKLGLNIVLADPNATYEVKGNENFESGLNIVEIVVTAQNGDQKSYTLNVYREQSGNTFLSKLEVSNEKEIFNLNPVFNKIISTYTVTVANEIETVEIEAVPEHSLTMVTGAGVKTLKVGTNTFSITSTAEDGSVQIYQVSIIRNKNSDATLKTLDVLEGFLSPSFQSHNFEYSVEVNSGITSLNLNVEPTVDTSKYAISGNYGFKVGKDNLVQIVVTAEDGTKNTYTIHVTRKPSTNNYLSYLNTDKYDMTPMFDKETEEYHITVENEVEKIKVDATPEDPLSIVKGNKTYDLQVGENEIEVTVTSEDGLVRSYLLHISRKKNYNTNLSSLTTDSSSLLDPIFDKEVTDYVLIVDSKVEEIAVIGTAEVSTSKVVGNGVYFLTTGENKITLTVTAEDGSTKDYHLTVIKEESSNANLSMIIAKESVLDPSFDKNKTDYILKVIESVTQLTLAITPEDPKATYTVIGNENFNIGENVVVVRVTAEDGTPKDYNLTVIRQEAGTTSNRLEWLAIDQGSLTPTFDKDTNYYEVEVSYEVESATLTGELEDKNATVTGFSTYDLKVGKNILSVQVVSVEGVVRYYQVVVTRKANTEARLASLQVTDSKLSPNFDKDQYEYSLSTTFTSLNISAIPLDSNATVEVIGNQNLQLGNNQVIIRVTAHDKVTTKDYILNVEKEKSKNNNLESLEVVGKDFTPDFSKTTTVYYLDVDNKTETIQVNATAEDENATITGDGLVNLIAGVNYVQIIVTSEAGTEKMYTIIVTREANSNNYLSKLEVSSGNLSPEFLKTVNDYTVTVPYEVDTITLSGVAEDPNAIVTGFDQYSLEVGQNEFVIVVTSEDGETNTYTVTVTREKIISSKLKELSVQNYQLNQTFNQDVYDYNIVVDSEVTALDIKAIPVDPEATYRIVGNENFAVGMNKIEIIVTDRFGNETTTYTLNVNRQNYANTYLAYIYPSKGVLSPSFDKTNLGYTVTVDGNVDTIDIMADVEVSTNTLTGDGTYTLHSGLNKISLVVTTPTGISRTYYVNVIRNLNNNNDLLSLEVTANGEVQPLIPTFDKSTLNYTVNVKAGTPSINILATIDESATITGIGNKILNVGENTFEIAVTAEDGSIKKYQLKVNREASNNNHLTDIIPSVGQLSPSFSYIGEEYSLVLDASSSLLSFDVVLEDPNAKVKGNEIQVIPDGLSKREIIVEAEDSSIRTYTINVYKEKTDEARLESLTIAGYTFNEVFDKDTFHYTVVVPNSKKLILPSEVEAIPVDSKATVSKTPSLVLTSTEENLYTIVVTAKDGFTKKTYTISITREKSDISTLDKLEILGLPLTPVFLPNVTEYTITLPSGVKRFTSDDVVAIPTDYDALVTIPPVYEYSDTNSVYEIRVESPDGSRTTTYQVHVEVTESNNALLSSLSIDHGVLTPVFDKGINYYTVELESEIDELEICAIAEEESATITGTGKHPVVTGLNRYEVVVTAEDGTINTYIIEATRKISSNTNILDLIPSSGSLTPSYDNKINQYEVVVDEEVESIAFEVLLESNKAIVTGNQEHPLNYGENDITITVTAEDGTVKEVVVTVIREKKVTEIQVEEEILMDVGDIEVLDVVVLPEDATNKELQWEVLDPSIVTVEDGVVTALSYGDTTITVSSKNNPDVKKVINVSVLNLKIASDVYDVRRDSIDLEQETETHNMVIGAEEKTTLRAFLSNLKNRESLIHFYDKDGNPITDLENQVVSTGMMVTLEYKTNVYDRAYIAVRGENTLDGRIDVDDLDLLDRQILGLSKYPNDSLIFKVSDVVETEKIDVDDSDKVEQYILGKIKTLN